MLAVYNCTFIFKGFVTANVLYRIGQVAMYCTWHVSLFLFSNIKKGSSVNHVAFFHVMEQWS